ncbi:MAG TPA: hypothetical protein VG944_12665 [Fimbriimonas sp.]|nr:hypothetical protein [Fimbriimonas sp.]
MQLSWQLFLFGDFCLLDPLGLPVRLANRKVEGVLAVLALHRQFGMERDELAEIVWPQRPLENQRASLRQALVQLKRAVGDENVEASRSHLRLSSKLSLTCDYDLPELRRANGFMPGHEGEWFDQIRYEGPRDEEAQDRKTPTVVTHFSETLNWMAMHDPRGMFELLKASKSLAKGLRFGNLLRLITLTERSRVYEGWSLFWRGASENDLQLCANLLRSSLKEAKKDNDLVLASEVCLELGKVYSRLGFPERADKICTIAETVAMRLQTRSAKSNFFRLKGTLLAHRGDLAGLEFLRRAEDLTDDVIEKASALSARAFFEGSLGLFEQSRMTLELVERVGFDLGHHRINVSSLMAKAQLLTAGGSFQQAAPELEKIAGYCYSSGNAQFGVYAEELMAKMFHLHGDRALAREKLTSARQARKGSQMATTPLEERRIAVFS